MCVCCSDGQVKPGGLHQAGVDQRSGGKSKSERRLAISESYICLVSFPDLIRHVDCFQYNAPCVVVRAICTAVGFGSGAETNLWLVLGLGLRLTCAMVLGLGLRLTYAMVL